jgi:hypothetical protein
MNYEAIWNEAQAAGHAAAEACRPRPMVVVSVDVFDRPLPGAEPEVVEDGLCGFAWIHMKGNIPFARWAREQKLGHKGYPSGYDVWVRGYGQSVARKEAFAKAAAKVLNAHGINCYANSRLD